MVRLIAICTAICASAGASSAQQLGGKTPRDTSLNPEDCKLMVVLGRELLHWDQQKPDPSMFAIFYLPAKGGGYVEQCPWRELGVSPLPLGEPNLHHAQFFAAPRYAPDGLSASVNFITKSVTTDQTGTPLGMRTEIQECKLTKSGQDWRFGSCQAVAAPAPINGCTIFDPIDTSKLPKGPPPAPPVVTAEIAARVQDFKPTAGADARIVLDTIDPLAGQRTTLVAERVHGTWTLFAAQDRGTQSHPQDTSARVTKSATLDAEQARSLESILSDECFWNTPPILPNSLPAKGGGDFTCLDGIDTDYRVEVGARRWYGSQKCRSVGLPGRVTRILYGATLQPTFTGSYQSGPRPQNKPSTPSGG